MSVTVAQKELKPSGSAAQNQEIKLTITVEVLQHTAEVTPDLDPAQVRFMVAAEQIIQEDFGRLAFAQNHQVGVAVAVKIPCQRQGAAAVRAGNPRGHRNVRKSAVGIVIPKLVTQGTGVADQDVEVPIVVSIQQQRGAPAGRLCAQAGLRGGVDEAALTFAEEQPIARGANHEEIQDSVVVDVAHATTKRVLHLLQAGTGGGIHECAVGPAMKAKEPAGAIRSTRDQDDIAGRVHRVRGCGENNGSAKILGLSATWRWFRRFKNRSRGLERISTPRDRGRVLGRERLGQSQFPHLIVLRQFDGFDQRVLAQLLEFLQVRLALLRLAGRLQSLPELVVGAAEIRPQFHGLEQFTFARLAYPLLAHPQQVPGHAIIGALFYNLLKAGNRRLCFSEML